MNQYKNIYEDIDLREGKVHGKTYSNWTSEWWKYMVSPNSHGKGGIFKSSEHDVWFLVSEFFNEDQIPIYKQDIPKGSYIIVPIANQFVASLQHGNHEELENIANYYTNSVTDLKASMKHNGSSEHVPRHSRVYTSISGLEFSNNLTTQVNGKPLFYIVGNTQSTQKDKEVDAFVDGYWLFFQIRSEGQFRLKTSARMLSYPDSQTEFQPKAEYHLNVH